MIKQDSGESPVTAEMQELWAKFCEFHALCLEASNNESLVQVSDKNSIKRLIATDALPWARTMQLQERELEWLEAKDKAEGREINLALLSLTKRIKGQNFLVPIVVIEVSVSESIKNAKLTLVSKQFSCSGSLIRAGFDDEIVQEIEYLVEELNRSSRLSFNKFSETLTKIISVVGSDYVFTEIVNTAPKENQIFIDWFLYQEPTNESAYTAKAIKELRDLANKTDWYKSPLGIFFGLPSNEINNQQDVVLAPIILNESQEQAIKYSQVNPLTIITGPPGTGKSQVIASFVSNSWFAMESIVVTSFNNAAVNVAVERIQAISKFAILRTGNREYKDSLSRSIEKSDFNLSSKEVDDLKIKDKQLRALVSNSYLKRAMRYEKSRRLIECEANLAECTEQLQRAGLEVWESLEKPTFIETVPKISRSLKRYLETSSGLVKWWHSFRLKRNLPKEKWNFDALEWFELCLSQEALQKNLRILEGFRLTSKEIEELDNEWIRYSRDFVVKKIDLNYNQNKKQFAQLGKDLVATGRSTFSNSTLSFAPAWATTALTFANDFKLHSESIETLVIDEASQTSFSAAIPLIYRARRLVLLGDPNQLEPVIQLTADEESAIARQTQVEIDVFREKSIGYVKNSVFKAFHENSSEEAHFFLDEHYRCHSVIAHWFNSQFYNGKLLLGSRNLGIQQGVQTCQIYGELEKVGSSWQNRKEAEKVIEIIRNLTDQTLSIGVVTPYRAQAELINRLLRKTEIEVEIVINTAHRFQGSERDVIIYSTVITESTPPNSFKWLKDQKNLINVSVSRAKELLFVVGNPDAARNPMIPELAALWEVARGEVDVQDAQAWIQTEAERALFNALLEEGILATPQMRIGGLTVDLAISTGQKNLAIEVDGKSHFDERGRRVRADYQRDRILNDHGWTVYRVPNWKVYGEIPRVVQELKKLI